jgi:hypothetical protein
MMPLGHVGIPLLVPLLGKNIRIDSRLLILGALLPDILDKPIGHLIMPENNGRIFAHTLLFAASFLILGIICRPCLSLSLGISFHQLLDGMFQDPSSSLWPLLGPFESYDFEVSKWIEALGDPYIIAEEGIGMVLIIIFILNNRLFIWKELKRFVLKGDKKSQK